MTGRQVKCSLLLLVIFATLLSVGCGGGSGDQARFRLVQAVPGQSSVEVLVDGNNMSSNLDYGAATDYLSVSSGSRHLQIEPTGSSSTIVDESVSFNGGDDYTLLLANTSPNVSTVTLTDDNTAPTSGDFKLRMINASSAIGNVDVYVVAPGTNISTTTPAITSLAVNSASDYQTLAAGTYQIYVTAPGTTFAYINTGSVTFTSGQIRSMVILTGLSGGYQMLTLSDSK